MNYDCERLFFSSFFAIFSLFAVLNTISPIRPIIFCLSLSFDDVDMCKCVAASGGACCSACCFGILLFLFFVPRIIVYKNYRTSAYLKDVICIMSALVSKILKFIYCSIQLLCRLLNEFYRFQEPICLQIFRLK